MCARFIRTTISSFIILLQISFLDCRVLCRDPNATPWLAIGFSCPINCANVIATIENLKIKDYSNIIQRETLNAEIRIQGAVGKTDRLSSSEDVEPTGANEVFARTWEKAGNGDLDDLVTAMKRYIYLRNGNTTDPRDRLDNSVTYPSCDSILQNKRLKKALRKKLTMQCTRRQLKFDSDLVAVMTSVLNKYTHPSFRFDEEMILLLLNKTLSDAGGYGSDGVHDIHKILRHLSTEIQQMKENNSIVRLTPKHCLNIYQPGCYCKVGYVERSSMCVQPEKCLTSPWQKQYLSRIEFY